MSQVHQVDPGNPRLRWITPVLLIALATTLAAWSWGRWSDALIDWSRLLYVGWRLSEGDALHRDVVFTFGPLAAWATALAFRLFGVGISTFVALNLAVLAGITALVVRLLNRLAGRETALAGGITFLCVFGFGHWIYFGNYNYVTPYEASLTLGILFALAALDAGSRFLADGQPRWLAWSGLALGAVFLTKSEVFAATGVALAVLLAGRWWITLEPAGEMLRRTGTFVAAALALPTLAFLCLLAEQGPAAAALGTLGSWRTLFAVDVLDFSFYRMGMGTDDVPGNARQLALMLAALGAPLLAVGAGCLALGRDESRVATRRLAALGVFGLTTAAGVANLERIPWNDVARPLPVAAIAMAVPSLVALWRRREGGALHVERLMVLAFAFVLLWKMVLSARISHYGFALAMPATLCLVAAMLRWMPDWIDRRGGRGELFRSFSAGAIAVLILGAFHTGSRAMATKRVTVAAGADAYQADFRGAAINDVIAYLEKNSTPDQTLAVFPEGVMLNYLARRRAPTPYYNYNPFEVTAHGEARMLAALRASPPDFVALAHKETLEFGVRFFGQDYARDLMAWIDTHYRPAMRSGAMPFTNRGFGILLLERREPQP